MSFNFQQFRRDSYEEFQTWAGQDFPGECVNWGDFGIVQVFLSEDMEDGKKFVEVRVEEAGELGRELSGKIAAWVSSRPDWPYPDLPVYVTCEW